MSKDDRVEQEREMEAQELNEEDEALLHFSHYSAARSAIPWEQRTFKERVIHHADRVFLFFLALFLLVMAGEGVYKIWYLTNWQKLYKFMLDTISYLLTQEEEEQLIEL